MKTGKNVIETLKYFEKQEANPKLNKYAMYNRLTMAEHLKSVRRLYNYCLYLERKNEILKGNMR